LKRKHQAFYNEKIGLLPLQKPIILSEDTPLNKAIKEMQKCDTGCVLIKNGERRLIGIFTERDVMKKFIGTSLDPKTPIREVMTSDPVILSPDATVQETIQFLGEKQIRHLPIGINTERIVGLLSVRVLVDFLADHMPEEILNLPPDTTVLPRYTDGG
jgi:CBS domain-containing protein